MAIQDRPPRAFEDLALGERRRSGGWTLTAEEIIDFARRYDPQWFHTDPEAARQSHFGGLIASGVQLISIWRALDHQMNGDIDNLAGTGIDDLRFLRAARPGDSLYLESEIVGLAASSSGQQRGRVTLAYRMLDQNDRLIMTLTSIHLVYTRAARAG